MTALNIDPTIPRQTFRQTLDGVDYIVGLAYNTRTDSYWLSLSLADGTPVLAGLHIVANWPLLRARRGRLFPAGELFCISDTGSTPAFGELGDSARLVYQSADEAA